MIIVRPESVYFSLENKSGLRSFYSPRYDYRWYLIERGEFKRGSNRPVVWGLDENKTYFVCPSCRSLNALDASDMVINGRDLDANACIVCTKCLSHFWGSFVGWVERKIRGSIKLDRRKCPFCKLAAHSMSRTVSSFTTGQTAEMDLYYCYRCKTYWKGNS